MGLRALQVEDITGHVKMARECGVRSAKKEPDWEELDHDLRKELSSLDDGCINGVRGLPIEKPLRVYINRFDSDLNGRSQYPLDGSSDKEVYSSASISSSHLLQESSSIQAFPPTRTRMDSPVSLLLSPFHTSNPTSGSSSSRLYGGRHEEVSKRKTVVEKIERLRESSGLEVFVPQCDNMSSTQMGMLIRRFGKRFSTRLPLPMRELIMEESVETPAAALKREDVDVASCLSNIADPDATDYEDDFFNISACRSTWDATRIQLGLVDHRIIQSIGQRMKEAEKIASQLALLVKREDEERSSRQSTGCARLIPCHPSHRRKLARTLKSTVDYSKMLPSTSRASVISHDAVQLQEGMGGYIHRLSLVPPMLIRKNPARNIWRNCKELEEEKFRNGLRRKEERDKRMKRKREGSEAAKSDSYEETDESDDDYLPPLDPQGRRINGDNLHERRERNREKRRRRKHRLREGHNPPLPLTKVCRRLSVAATVARVMPAVNRPSSIDADDILFEPAILNLPQKMEYKEICIPSWREVAEDGVSLKGDVEAAAEEYEMEELTLRVAQMHHPFEYEERRRFQAWRAAAARSGSQSPPPQETPPPRPAEVPPFDYTIVLPRTDYERASIIAPYSPRRMS